MDVVGVVSLAPKPRGATQPRATGSSQSQAAPQRHKACGASVLGTGGTQCRQVDAEVPHVPHVMDPRHEVHIGRMPPSE